MFSEIRNKLLNKYKELDFLTGGCYIYARLITEKYGGKIYINRELEHCAVMYEGELYDIKGKIKRKDGFRPIKKWEEKMCKKEYKLQGMNWENFKELYI